MSWQDFFLISFQLINLNFDMTLLNNLWSFVLENKKVSQKFSRNEINSRFIEVASFFCQTSTWNRSSQIVQWVNISKSNSKVAKFTNFLSFSRLWHVDSKKSKPNKKLTRKRQNWKRPPAIQKQIIWKLPRRD